MFRKIRIAALSALLGLGTLAGMPATAQADGIYFSFGNDGPRGGFHARDHRRHHRHPPRWARTCTPGEAVHKARRMGLRNAHVTRANRNVIRVSGHRHRHRANIVFARAPNCPVIRAL